MTNMYFDLDRSIKLKKLLKAIHNPEERRKWDKDVEQCEYLSLSAGEDMQVDGPAQRKLLLYLLRMKSNISFIQRREFLEKKLKFKVAVPDSESPDKPRARHFVFFSSVPDVLQESDKTITRATIILGIHMFERLQDGRLHFQSIV